jgi:hypothetical protein
MTTTAATRYNVIVESVGTANPVVSKLLAESLELPVEMVTKAIYTAPAVLFHKVDEELALRANDLLSQLGLKVSVKEDNEALPPATDLVDIGVYVSDISKLPLVCKQLSEFLGCEVKDALALLMNETGIVMGNVSVATAEALSERLDAEVLMCTPVKDLYTIEFETDDHIFNLQFLEFLKSLQIPTDGAIRNKYVEHVNYDASQKIWNRFQSSKKVKVCNESFQRFEVILEKADVANPACKRILLEEVGIPENILPQVLENLPVQLHESVVMAVLFDMSEKYKAAGLDCTVIPVYKGAYHLVIEHMTDLEKTKTILTDYFDKHSLPKKESKWQSPKEINNLVGRYLLFLLEKAGCIAELKPASI